MKSKWLETEKKNVKKKALNDSERNESTINQMAFFSRSIKQHYHMKGEKFRFYLVLEF